MKHKTKKRIFTTIGIIAIILLFIFGVWGFFHYIVSKQANPPAFISAISSLMIALLTLVYVITTNRQLRAMRAQLFEMKRSREISTQPLPLVVLKDMYLEKPRVYYSPPEKECAGISRYILECSVSNFGSSPAVCVHMCACIHIGTNENEKSFNCAAEFLNIISGTPVGTQAQEQKILFMFSDDKHGVVIDALRESKPKELPLLQLCTAYKNVAGGSFYCRQRYTLQITSEKQDEVLKNWFSQISTFDNVYRHEVNELRQLYDNNSNQWDEKFDALKEAFGKTIIGEDQHIGWFLIPDEFSVGPISKEEYKDIVCQGSYPGPITIHGCPYEK